MAAYSKSLDQSIQRARAIAKERGHAHATLEHLLLALTDDPDAAAVMRACHVDIEKLSRAVSSSLATPDESPVVNAAAEPQKAASLEDVLQRAVVHVQSAGGHIHQQGIGECGIYAADVAKTKAAQVLDFSRTHQHPLRCVVRPIDRSADRKM
jgi:ATP-dependent Clp protease ATP-binding subunit ClpA